MNGKLTAQLALLVGTLISACLRASAHAQAPTDFESAVAALDRGDAERVLAVAPERFSVGAGGDFETRFGVKIWKIGSTLSISPATAPAMPIPERPRPFQELVDPARAVGMLLVSPSMGANGGLASESGVIRSDLAGYEQGLFDAIVNRHEKLEAVLSLPTGVPRPPLDLTANRAEARLRVRQNVRIFLAADASGLNFMTFQAPGAYQRLIQSSRPNQLPETMPATGPQALPPPLAQLDQVVEVTNGVSLGFIFESLRITTGTKIYCHAGWSTRRLYVSGNGRLPAYELLAALESSTGGVYRPVGSAYVFAPAMTGLGVAAALWQELARSEQRWVEQASRPLLDQLKARLPGMTFPLSNPAMAFTEEQRAQRLTNEHLLGLESVRTTFGQLTPAQREAAQALVASGPPGAITLTETTPILLVTSLVPELYFPSRDLAVSLPDAGAYLDQIAGEAARGAAPQARPPQPRLSYTQAKDSLPTDHALVITLDQLRANPAVQIADLWVRLSAGQAQRLLEGQLSEAATLKALAGKGTKITLVLQPAWGSFPVTQAESILGRTWEAIPADRRWSDGPDGFGLPAPSVDPRWVEAVRATGAAQVAFTDPALPGFALAENLSSSYGMEELGYNVSLRERFLREYSVDPIDLPMAGSAIEWIRFGDSTLVQSLEPYVAAWNRFRRELDENCIEAWYAALSPAGIDLWVADRAGAGPTSGIAPMKGVVPSSLGSGLGPMALDGLRAKHGELMQQHRWSGGWLGFVAATRIPTADRWLLDLSGSDEALNELLGE